MVFVTLGFHLLEMMLDVQVASNYEFITQSIWHALSDDKKTQRVRLQNQIFIVFKPDGGNEVK